MAKLNIFAFKTYKAVMEHFLFGEGNWGQLTKAADALRCQKSYLSRVIKAELHITPDHAYKLAIHWRLSAEERDYFLTLVDWERAADPEYRKFLDAKIKEFRRKHESIQERTERKSLVIDSFQATYFSSWLNCALHFLSSIPQCQTVNAMSERLSIKKELVEMHLNQLSEYGYVEEKNGKWIYKGGEFHAPKDSPLVVLHHQNWRTRSILDAQNFNNQSVHYTAVQTMSRADAEKIKELMLQFIADSSRIAGPSKPEEAIAITCDLFTI